MIDDLELAQLLCTRICHDLAGPVGAVSAGIELLEDEGDPAFLGETVALLHHSASASSAKLKFLRAALGASSRATDGSVRGLVSGWIEAVAGQNVKLDWNEYAPALAGDPEAARILLNLAATGVDCVNGAGSLIIEVRQGATAFGFTATVRGDRAALSDDLRSALEGRRDGLTPCTAQAYLLHRLATDRGGLSIDEKPGEVRLGLHPPIAA